MFKKICAIFIVPMLFMLAACSSAPSAPTDLNGKWTSTDSSYKFVADISANKIVVSLGSDDVSALYWQGDFTVPTPLQNGATIESKADADALAGSILGSQDPTKTFTYENNKLKFNFSAMGVTKVIELARN